METIGGVFSISELAMVTIVTSCSFTVPTLRVGTVSLLLNVDSPPMVAIQGLSEENEEKRKVGGIANKKNHFDRGLLNSANPYQNPLFYQRTLLFLN